MDKIICLGKNFAEHAEELAEPSPEKPVVFIKPPSCLKAAKKMGEKVSLRFPSGRGVLHHECEVVLRLGRGGFCMDESQALSAIDGITLGLDMTLREEQTKLKRQGHPWTVSKVFIDTAVVGPFITVSEFENYLDEPFSFSIGGQVRQRGDAREMMLSPSECVSYASHFFPLVSGDLIFTGTPKGVGPVCNDDFAELRWGPVFYEVKWIAENLKA